MPSKRQLASKCFSADTLEFISLLYRHGVVYLIVGGEAVIFPGHLRLTGDVDFFYERTPGNSKKLFECLQEFWDGMIPEVEQEDDFMDEGVIFQFGRPPNRIDLLNKIDGVEFDEAWATREVVEIRGGAESVANQN